MIVGVGTHTEELVVVTTSEVLYAEQVDTVMVDRKEM